ncbi:MAG TPA: hypothetical protein EYN38_04495 [Flavobacteriales bacterium]|nr:hypothetical protein [Flavobacteriales bacterium]HIA11527.1 hypothetical protein [Flavobacteriales bacterium]HIO72348.1 hypothetical protein [Flavobacteriales bacterium]
MKTAPLQLTIATVLCLFNTSIYAQSVGAGASSFSQGQEAITHEFTAALPDKEGCILCTEEKNIEIAPVDIGPRTLVEFGLMSNGGKVYTHWHVNGEKENGLFIVERSTNQRDYEQIGIKRGIGVQIENKILYCWVDEDPMEGVCWYRLLKVYEDGRYYYSQPVNTEQEQPIRMTYKEGTPLAAASNQ